MSDAGRSKTHVVDRVDAGAVLEHEQRRGDEQAAEQGRVAEDVAERGPEAEADGLLVGLDRGLDLGELLGEVRVGSVELADPAQVAEGLVAATLLDEPCRKSARSRRATRRTARRLLEDGRAEQVETGRDELDVERDDPLLARGADVLRDAAARGQRRSVRSDTD